MQSNPMSIPIPGDTRAGDGHGSWYGARSIPAAGPAWCGHSDRGVRVALLLATSYRVMRVRQDVSDIYTLSEAIHVVVSN
jgi:hypothetical protein